MLFNQTLINVKHHISKKVFTVEGSVEYSVADLTSKNSVLYHNDLGLITDEYVLSVLKLNNYEHKLVLTTQKK